MNQDSLCFKKATLKDYDSYYSIRSEKLNLFWTGYEKAPDYTNFSKWFTNRINEDNRDLYLLFENDNCIGSLNMDFYNDYVFIGYSVKEQSAGKGIGTYLVKNAIALAMSSPKIKSIKAWINFQNIGSIRVVQKNGFIKNDVTEVRKRFGKDELYYQFELNL